MLRDNGILDIILCIGHLGDQIKEYLGDGGEFGIRVRYSQEKEKLLGTGGALKHAEDLLNERFFVINGDTYLPIDYRQVEDFLLRSRKKAVTVVYDNREDTGVSNNIELDGQMIVAKYEKGESDSTLKYVEAGVLVLRRELLSLLKKGRPASLERSLYPPLIHQQELAAYLTEQRFYDIGTWEGLQAFEAFLERERR